MSFNTLLEKEHSFGSVVPRVFLIMPVHISNMYFSETKGNLP